MFDNCRTVNSCTRNYIPACQVLFLDRRFLYRIENAPPALRPARSCRRTRTGCAFGGMAGAGTGGQEDRRTGGQERRRGEGEKGHRHQGNPLPHLRGLFDPAHLRHLRPVCPSVNAGNCTFSAFSGKPCAARVCGVFALLALLDFARAAGELIQGQGQGEQGKRCRRGGG